jgi:tetratricopeptide (TPR) repeat protein
VFGPINTYSDLNSFYMSTLRKIIVATFCFANLNSFSQEIRDDTIYTTLGDPSFLLFPDKITECEYSDKDGYIQFEKKMFNGNSVRITAKVKNPSQINLKVSEGGRNHLFILGYKEEVAANELDHDWEDLKKLKSYVEALEKKKSVRQNMSTSTAPTQVAPATAERKDEIEPPKSQPVATTDKSLSYLSLVQSGIKEFNSRNFEKAKEYFQAAIEKNSSDKLAKDWLADTENKLYMAEVEKDKLQKEEEFRTIVKSADEKLKAGYFELAEQEFQRADKIKQGDTYVTSRLTQIKQKLDELSTQKLNKERDEKYNENIGRGDLALKDGKLEEAKAAFDIAKRLKPGEKYPVEKMREIDNLKVKQEAEARHLVTETKFKDEMNLGLEAYNAGNRDVARRHFVNATNIKKDPAAEELIKKIDLYKRDSIQLVRKAEAALAQEKLNTEKYKFFKEIGDKAFDEHNYPVAIKNYNLAYTYKQENYIKEQLAEIDKKLKEINLANERKKQFNSLSVKLQAALNNNDFNNAQIYYNQIVDLKLEDEPLIAKLKTFQNRLDVIRKEKERNDQYDTAISKAAQAIGDGAYNTALKYYNEASSLKPQDGYATGQIIYVNGLLLDIEERKRSDQRFQQKKQIVALQSVANKAVTEKRWKEARELFQKIIDLDPSPVEKNFAFAKIRLLENEIRKQDSIASIAAPPVVVVEESKLSKEDRKRRQVFFDAQAKLEKARLDTIAAQLKRRNEPSLARVVAVQPTLNNNTTKNYVNAFLQEEAIPYKHEELIKKYPEVNFEKEPDGQTYDRSDRKNAASNFKIIKIILSDTSNLNLSDSINYIKGICKNISFNGNNAFIKVLIRNNSLTDFLTGRIQFKVVRKNKGTVDLHQRYISDFPIVLPQKEYPFVYVTDGSLEIDPADILIMQINDRSNKIKLQIKIPGNLYNSRKTARL